MGVEEEEKEEEGGGGGGRIGGREGEGEGRRRHGMNGCLCSTCIQSCAHSDLQMPVSLCKSLPPPQ